MDRVQMWDKNIRERFYGEAAPLVRDTEKHVEEEAGQELYGF